MTELHAILALCVANLVMSAATLFLLFRSASVEEDEEDSQEHNVALEVDLSSRLRQIQTTRFGLPMTPRNRVEASNKGKNE